MLNQLIKASGAVSGVVSIVTESSDGLLVMLSGHHQHRDVVFCAPVWLPRALLVGKPLANEQVIRVSGALRFAPYEPFQPQLRLVLEADSLTPKTVGIKKIIGSRKTHTAKAFGVYLEDATNICVVDTVQVEDLCNEQLTGIGTLVIFKMLGLGGTVHCVDPLPYELNKVPLLATVGIEGMLTSEPCRNSQFPISYLVSSRIEPLGLTREMKEANSVEDLVPA